MSQSTPLRYAIYFTPEPSSALARFGARVIGYDSATGHDLAQPELKTVPSAQLFAATEAPRRYGFHATLVAPFTLREGNEAQLHECARAFCSRTKPVSLGRLDLATLSGFIALVPGSPDPQLTDFAARCVEHFNPLRAPLSESDFARRNKEHLTSRQRAYLERFGYPYVFDEFRFHMTLSHMLRETERDMLLAELARAYAPIADEDHRIDAISILRQNGPTSRFQILARYPLSGGNTTGG